MTSAPRNMAGLSLWLLFAIGCGARSALQDGVSSNCDAPEHDGMPRGISGKEVKEIGALGHPASASFRDGGSADRIRERLLWTFGDTLLTMPAEDGQPFRSSSAGYAAPGSDLLSVVEDTDATGAPRQLVPYTDEELSFNATHSGDDRWGLWPFAT